MPAYDDVLSDEEIVAALSWIKAQWPAGIRARHDELNRTEGATRAHCNARPLHRRSEARQPLEARLGVHIRARHRLLPSALLKQQPAGHDAHRCDPG